MSTLATAQRAPLLDRPSRTGRASLARRCAEIGGGAALCGGLGLHLMQQLPATEDLNPMSEPLSKYALTPAGWLFDLAVVALAVAVAGVLAALVLGRQIVLACPASAALATCAAGLVSIVIFPDYTTSTGHLTTTGWVHWAGSVAAFAGAPAATLLLSRHRRRAEGFWLLVVARWLSLGAAACLAVFVAGTVLEWTTELPVWRVGGVVERGLSAVEIVIAVALAGWARAVSSHRPVPAVAGVGAAGRGAEPLAATVEGER